VSCLIRSASLLVMHCQARAALAWYPRDCRRSAWPEVAAA
jgi:hypothetical protein